jgi:hypothetical protein
MNEIPKPRVDLGPIPIPNNSLLEELRREDLGEVEDTDNNLDTMPKGGFNIRDLPEDLQEIIAKGPKPVDKNPEE